MSLPKTSKTSTKTDVGPLVKDVRDLSKTFETPRRRPTGKTMRRLVVKERALLRTVLAWTSAATTTALLAVALGKHRGMRAAIRRILTQTAVVFPDIRESLVRIARRRLPSSLRAWFPEPEDIALAEGVAVEQSVVAASPQAPRRSGRVTGFLAWWFTHPQYWTGVFPYTLAYKAARKAAKKITTKTAT